ncbi:hypothetical protein NX783_09140 [Massilia kyonggiensis]|nr:hypothetical protein [Massilia kyonggiensis]
MNPHIVSSLRDGIFALKESYDNLHLPAIEGAAEASQKLSSGAYAGKGRELIVEAQVRTYLIDPILKTLGWQLNLASEVLVEAAVDPTDTGENRRFLDYFGRETDETVARPLLIVEAKRASASLPGAPTMQQYERLEKIVGAFAAISAGEKKTRHIGAEWITWLKTLVDYVRRIYVGYGTAPKCVAMTNGEWFLVFTNPHATFIDNSPTTDDIQIYESLEAVIRRVGEFHAALSFGSLSSLIPIQHPADLHQFVAAGSSVDLVMCLELTFNYVQDVQPSISARVYARVQVSPNVWVTFRIEHSPIYQPIPPKESMFWDGAAALQECRDQLLNELSKYASLNLLKVTEYEKRVQPTAVPSPMSNSPLCSSTVPGVFHLVLGDTPFFATANDEYDECSYHAFGPANAIGLASSTAPFIGPTRNPPVYFHSGSNFHCAHRTVHSQRQKKCILLAFESHLCCNRCAFVQHCWPNGTSSLPCSKS